MDEAVLCVPTVQLSSEFCRICISISEVNYYIYEESDETDGTKSLHLMLGKLFPVVFNDEQSKSDETMNWPARVCHNCKCMVAEAYTLYELCMTSTDKLRKLLTVEQVVLDAKDHPEMDEENQPSTQVVKSEEVQAEETLPSSFLKRKRGRPAKSDAISKQKAVKSESKRFALKKYKLGNGGRRKKVSKEIVTYEDPEDSMENSREEQLCMMQSSECIVVELETNETEYSRRSPTVDDSPNTVPMELNEKASKQKPTRSRQGKVKVEQKTKTAQLNVEGKEMDPDETDEPKTKIDLYRCQLCDGPTYTSPTELTGHLKAVHPDQIRSCEQCPKVFMSEQAFQHHQYCHAIGRSHFCIFCDKGFQTQDLLKGHIRTHTHRTDYLCFLCGKEFSNSSNLRQHVKRHYGEKPWACEQCPMRFSTKGYLTRHHQTHSKIKKFTCDTCGSHFSRQYTLMKHQLIHTGARFFSCEVCKMSFTSSDHVKRHMRTHTGEKPYKCGCCGRAFAQSNDMVKHMRTHLGDNAYQCDRCNASYRLLSELRNHYKEHYQPAENATGCSSAEEEKEIRFTSMSILNRHFDKKPKGLNK